MASVAVTLEADRSAILGLQRLLPTASLLVYCGVLFFLGLGDQDLHSSHEARAAQNAQTMLDTGNWLLPRLFDGHVELQKPPLFYWLVATLGMLGGGHVNAWCVRLPAALAALGCVLWLFFLGCRRQRPLAGYLAALILASCLHFTALARIGRIDLPLTFAVALTLGSFHLAHHERGRTVRLAWRFLGYSAIGAGLLLKGPIAVLLPLLVAITCWLIENRGSLTQSVLAWRPGTLWWGVPWLGVLALPWFFWANQETDGRLADVFFWYHNVERGLGGSDTLAAHPWWFYGPRAFVDLLPWSLFLPLAIVWWCRTPEARDDAETRQALTWFAAIACFLSCMSFKRADYLLPAYPGFALFLGMLAERWWWRHSPGALSRKRIIAAGIGVVLTYALAWTGYNAWLISVDEDRWPHQRLAREIRRQTDGPVIFFRAESHLLAFHVGQPVGTILEWENLEIWATQPFPVYFVMPEDCARAWAEHLPMGRLEEVMRSSDWARARDAQPVVILRTRGEAGARQ